MLCKYSAMARGYFDDPILRWLVEREDAAGHAPSSPSPSAEHAPPRARHPSPTSPTAAAPSSAAAPPRKPPIINRGYYARVHLINDIVQRFLALTAGQHRQLLALGAGLDTWSLRLTREGHAGLTAFEVDFDTVLRRKVDLCASVPAVREVLLAAAAGSLPLPSTSSMSPSPAGPAFPPTPPSAEATSPSRTLLGSGRASSSGSRSRPLLPTVAEDDEDGEEGAGPRGVAADSAAINGTGAGANPVGTTGGGWPDGAASMSFGPLRLVAADLRQASAVMQRLR